MKEKPESKRPTSLLQHFPQLWKRKRGGVGGWGKRYTYVLNLGINW